MRLFISHATVDLPLVKIFMDLVESGVGVEPRAIFCSSLRGQGVKPGVDFIESIHSSLNDATCVTALISPNFYASAFCMCELGGTWLRSKSFLPILVPPHEFSDLKAVLQGVHVLKIASAPDLDHFRDELADRLDIKPLSTPRWNERRDEFLGKLPSVLRRLPPPATVPEPRHQKVVDELAEYKTEFQDLQKALEKDKHFISELKALKDKKEVARVVRKHSSAVRTFKHLISQGKESLKGLSGSAKTALYYRARNDEYRPEDQDEWRAVQAAAESGQVDIDEAAQTVTVRRSDPMVRKATQAIDELETWLDSEDANSGFYDWYEEQYDGQELNLKLRPFWDRHLLR